jgi:hypothetical protein
MAPVLTLLPGFRHYQVMDGNHGGLIVAAAWHTPDVSERGGCLQNDRYKIAKRTLAWPGRSEGKSVPA